MGKKRKATQLKKVQPEPLKPKPVEPPESESESESEPEINEEFESAESESEQDSEEEEEDQDEASKRETLRKLLEPFGKDQIIQLLKEAALHDQSIVTRIAQSADSDPAHRKIFIHGLGWDATPEQVLFAFKPYGDIEECKVVTDKATGKTKGYGFVLFKTRGSARKALKERQKKIGSRMTSCQLASAGPVSNQPLAEVAGRKIFVANVGPHVKPDSLKSFFAKFGEVEEGPMGIDPVTGKFKGFAILTYKTAEGCKKALEEPTKVFEGCQLQCRLSVEGQRGIKNQTGGPAPLLQQSDLAALNYGVGLSPGFYGHTMNPAALLLAQNHGIGLANPMLVSRLSPSVGAATSLGFGGSYGVNTVSPSVIGSYGSQAALQGLGAYQSAQLRNSPAAATGSVAGRSQSGFGSAGTTFPAFYGP